MDRQSLPAVFRAFDFASPDQSAERRPRTTVPQQALFSMNAPFVIEQAKALALAARRRGRDDDRGTDRRALPGRPGADPRPRPRSRRPRGSSRRSIPAVLDPAILSCPAGSSSPRCLLMTNELLFVDSWI